MKKLAAYLSIALWLCIAEPCRSIDNPDAPDYVAEFQQRAQVYEKTIDNATSNQEFSKAYADYERFLDGELNRAYKALTAELAPEQLSLLKQSQREWLKYRDAEFAFIAANWTTSNFGSSSVLSQGVYRTDIIQNRVILLLNYLKNYPA